jgi:DNA-directed RNA polymerase specialized sigma24 family protein
MRQVMREERTQRLAKEWLAVLESAAPLPPEPLHDERRIVLEALDRLPRRHRLIITWMYIEGLRAEGIKERLESTFGKKLTDGAFRMAKHRARKALATLREISVRETGADSTQLTACLRGEEPLGDVGGHRLAMFREAYEALKPRLRRFLDLDMVEGASSAEIQRRMGLSHRALLRLRREALAALQEALAALYARRHLSEAKREAR